MSDPDQTDLTTARAVRIERFGGPEVIEVASIAVPPLGDGEVLVRTAVASVNPVDWKIAEGKYPPLGEDKLPIVLGRDLSGTVVAVGGSGGDLTVGKRVCAFIDNDRGAQSTLVVVKTNEAVEVPEGVSLEVAGAVPLAAMTAWQGLFDHGGVEAGQSVLIPRRGGRGRPHGRPVRQVERRAGDRNRLRRRSRLRSSAGRRCRRGLQDRTLRGCRQ